MLFARKSFTISSMKKLNNSGEMNVLLIPTVMLAVLFVSMSGFAIWSYMSRQDYKENTDQKVATAVEVAKEETSTEKDNEFVEKEKLPFDDYQGPAAFGGILIRYPKTWSAYVNEGGKGRTPIDGYFHPKFVPATDVKPSYALRVQVLSTTYANELKKYDTGVKNGVIKATPYKPEKVPTVTGVRMDGEIMSKVKGSMILVPMRDKTLKIWTEADSTYLKDFNENILPNYSFEP